MEGVPADGDVDAFDIPMFSFSAAPAVPARRGLFKPR